MPGPGRLWANRRGAPGSHRQRDAHCLDPANAPASRPASTHRDPTPASAGHEWPDFSHPGGFLLSLVPEFLESTRHGPVTHYHPSLGFYSQDDRVSSRTDRSLQYGKIQLGIASWWGQGHYTDQRFATLLQAGEKVGFIGQFTWKRRPGQPSVAAITSDLQYIHDKYASSPAYLKMGGRFVVFVYADPGDNCGMVDRRPRQIRSKPTCPENNSPVIRNAPTSRMPGMSMPRAGAEKGVGNDRLHRSVRLLQGYEPQPRWRATCSNGCRNPGMLASKANSS